MSDMHEKKHHSADLLSLDFREMSGQVWRKKSLVFAGGMVAAILALAYLFLSKPVYYAEALVAEKSVQAPSSALGDLVASQLGGNRTELGRVSQLLQTYDLNAEMLRKHKLVPRIFAHEKVMPNHRKATEKFIKNNVRIMFNKNSRLLTVGVVTHDSLLSRDIVRYQIAEVEEWIRKTAIEDGEKSVAYLEDELRATQDPVMQETIRRLIAAQIEKKLVLGASPFTVLETPRVPLHRFGTPRRQVVTLAFITGAFFTVLAIIAYGKYRAYKSSLA